jgi:hypothetical protein
MQYVKYVVLSSVITVYCVPSLICTTQTVFIFFIIFFYLVEWGLTPLGSSAGPLGSYKSQYCGHTLAYCTFSPDDI